jgi:hypothetical protein
VDPNTEKNSSGSVVCHERFLAMCLEEEVSKLKTEVEQLKDNYEFLVQFYREKIYERTLERDKLIRESRKPS